MFEKVSEQVFAFFSQSAGSNVFLVKGSKEIALIDSSTGDNKAALIDCLKGSGFEPKDISLVLHTHGHADHFGNDSLFKNAKIAMCGEDAKRINASDRAFACIHYFPETKLPKVSLFLKDKQVLDLGGISLRVIHSPGHTAGSVCFFEPKSKALFSGDTLFSQGFGRTDLSSGSSKKMLESLQNMQKLPFELLLPGHGPFIRGEKDNELNLKAVLEMASTNTFL